jgi:hypothetical protein
MFASGQMAFANHHIFISQNVRRNKNFTIGNQLDGTQRCYRVKLGLDKLLRTLAIAMVIWSAHHKCKVVLSSFALNSLTGQRHYAKHDERLRKDRAEAGKIGRFVSLRQLAQDLVVAHQAKISRD